MSRRAQLKKDCICGGLIITFSYVFFTALSQYLSGLQKPVFLFSAFSLSLVASYIFELRYDRTRENYIKVAALAILFSAGVLLAEHYRLYYLDLLSQLDDIRGARELIGTEYLYLVSSKVVGYGSAYGLGLITTRIIGRTSLINVLSEHLILPEYRAKPCIHCQQNI